MSQNQMFCYQCEQTAKGQGCTVAGVCGKTADVAALQDLLVYMLRGLGQLSTEAAKAGVKDEDIDLFTCEALFATLTNVNFDPEAMAAYIKKTAGYQEQLRSRLFAIKAKVNSQFNLQLEKTTAELIQQGKQHGINSDPTVNTDLHSLQWLLTYGLKGVAAYTYHAALLGKKDQKVFDFVNEGLAAALDKSLGVNEFVALVFKCGEINVRAMELLDAGNTERYGHPTPTRVPLGHRKGKAILVSGHDLIDLDHILKQTEGKGITVYTHGEMLPTHGYPGLNKYPHFYGHYGTAWQNQQKEFAAFPGAILMTTNCIQRPMESYRGNIFTSGPVGYPGVPHISGEDFSPVIQKALGTARVLRRRGRQVGSGRLRQKRSPKRSGQSHRLSQERAHQTLHTGRRMRRRKTRQKLLHGVRGESTQRHGHPDVGMRQIPLLRQGTRHNRRNPAAARHRAMQRRLLSRQNRAGIGGCVRGIGQRAASVARALLVRTESRSHPAVAALPRHKEHPHRTKPASLHHARHPQRTD